MKFLFLVLISILATNKVLGQNYDWKNQRAKTRAYTLPIGTTKRVSENAIEYKIKLPVSNKETRINLFLNKHNDQNEEYASQRVECLNYLKGESRFFSILVDSIDSGVKVLLSTPVSMGRFQIEENKNLKYIFIDSERTNKNNTETIVILYKDTNQSKIEERLKNKKIINEKNISKDINTIYRNLKPYYTITYKEEEL